jgi:outer membrane protein assembly factor BamB
VARWLLAGSLVAIASLGSGERQATGQASGDWPALQGGSGHSGLAAASFRPPLKASWRAAPGGDGRLSTPVVSTGLAISTGRNSVVGFDPASGEVLWSVERAEGLVIAPAMDPGSGPEGTVAFVEGNGPGDSRLVGVDRGDRTRLWATPLGAQSRSAPNVAAGLVFVGTRDRTVLAVAVESGREAWRARTEGAVATSPAIADGKVLVVSEEEGSGRSRVYALDASGGEIIWSYSPPGISVGVSSPSVSDGSVYVGFGDANLRAFDLASGDLLWTSPTRAPFSPLTTLASAKGSVFALDRGGGVYRFDGGTGELRWDYQFPSLVTWSSPIVVGDHVFVGLDDGTIAAIDIGSGHVVWQTRLRQGAIGAFSPFEGLLLAPAIGPRGGVIAFEEAPDRALVDISSPSELDLPSAMINFLGASAAVLALLLFLFGFVLPRLRLRS